VATKRSKSPSSSTGSRCVNPAQKRFERHVPNIAFHRAVCRTPRSERCAWSRKLRTTRSKEDVVSLNLLLKELLLKNASLESFHNSQRLERGVRNTAAKQIMFRTRCWKHCGHHISFALVYIAQLGVLYIVESHAGD
jgi:hypothetical protein